MDTAPETIRITVDTVSSLTQLLALHGVYALLVFFMFIQQRRARLNLKEARTQQDQQHFRQQHLWTTIAVFTLSAVVSAVWIYGNFFYSERVFIQGALKDLVARQRLPEAATDPPWLVQRLAPFRTDVDFYTSLGQTPSSDQFDLNWVTVSESSPDQLLLRFQQHARVLTSPASLNTPPTHLDRILSGDVRLDLDLTHSWKGERLHLLYRPHSTKPLEQLGDILLEVGGELRPLPWLERGENTALMNTTQPRLISSWTTAAWAHQLPAPHDQDVPVGGLGAHSRWLLTELSSSDLERQIAAQRTILNNSPQSLAIIAEILRATRESGEANSLAIHNLAFVTAQLLDRGHTPDPQLHKELGSALYEIEDYSRALTFLEYLKATSEDRPQIIQKRAISYFKIGKYPEAISESKAYLDVAETTKSRSIGASNLGAAYARMNRVEEAEAAYIRALDLDPHNLQAKSNLGYLYLRQGDLERAARFFEAALAEEPKWLAGRLGVAIIAQKKQNFEQARTIFEALVDEAPTNSSILNNLAFLYAETGENLELGLEYVERAIDVGGERPEYLDTRGWLFFKQGRLTEAKEQLEQALRLAPESNDILEHFRAVTTAAQSPR